MSKTKVIETKIDQLIPDDLNANIGTEYGGHLIEKSFRELGAGRSILLDKNNNIIAGNKSTEKCAAIGLEDVIIVETDGTKLVAVKRTDIDINSKQGRELALADNATSKANLVWDDDIIQQISEQFDVNPVDWGVKEEFAVDNENDPFDDKGIGATNKYGVIVSCDTEAEQEQIYSELTMKGYTCKVVVV